MKKEKLPYWISSIAVVISIVSACVAIYRNETNLSFDYLGLIVSILAIIAALLLGWQIFSLINFEERVRKMSREVSVGIIKEYNLTIESLIGALINKNDIASEPEHIDKLFDAAEKALSTISPNSSILPLFFIETIIKAKDPAFLVILKNKKDYYKSIVTRSNYKNSSLILKALDEAEEIEDNSNIV